ncbi:hypothetical protein [Cohnella abietis]|uniref:Uncharacterized protein n=1 Tax=Cohnella abietis TaxID=2507935 RepID=A0A3T1CY88_9BACL|nr:hypothetical protein [Cohnella abietis]BBI30739.1 hypothetical protein KCTCHS21_01380 [Cohnella abietis]
MRKNGSIASFGDVAKGLSNTNANINVNASVNINGTFIDQIVDKQESSVLMGLYIKNDIAKVLNALAKKAGRGGKSKVANEALKKIFIEAGLM